MGYFELGYLESLTISNSLWGPLTYINPDYLKLIIISIYCTCLKHFAGSSKLIDKQII